MTLEEIELMAVLVSVTFFIFWMIAGSIRGRFEAVMLQTKATIGNRHRPYTTPLGCILQGK